MHSIIIAAARYHGPLEIKFRQSIWTAHQFLDGMVKITHQFDTSVYDSVSFSEKMGWEFGEWVSVELGEAE